MVNWRNIGAEYFPEHKEYFQVDDPKAVWEQLYEKSGNRQSAARTLFHQIITTPTWWRKGLQPLAEQGLKFAKAKKISVAHKDVEQFHQGERIAKSRKEKKVQWQNIGESYFPEYAACFDVKDACDVWQKLYNAYHDKNNIDKANRAVCDLFHQIVILPDGWRQDVFGPGHTLTALAERGLEMIRAKQIPVSDEDVARFYQWKMWMEEGGPEPRLPALPVRLPEPLVTRAPAQVRPPVPLPPPVVSSASSNYALPISLGIVATLLGLFFASRWGGGGDDGGDPSPTLPLIPDDSSSEGSSPPSSPPPEPPAEDPLPIGKEVPLGLRSGKTYYKNFDPKT